MPTISTPADGTTRHARPDHDLQGSATDPEDGPVAGERTELDRAAAPQHPRPHVRRRHGHQGSFVAENHGSIGTFSYEIILTATDSSGLEGQHERLTSRWRPTRGADRDRGADRHRAGRRPDQPGLDSRDRQRGGERLPRRALPGRRLHELRRGGNARRAPATADSGLAARRRTATGCAPPMPSGNLGGYSNVATTDDRRPPPPTGLVAAWALSEGAGTTTADASGNGNTGTIAGRTWSTAGPLRRRAEFNGVSSLVRVASSASLNLSTAMTLEAWIRPPPRRAAGARSCSARSMRTSSTPATSDGPLRPSGGGTFGGATRVVSGPTREPDRTPGRTWR